MALQKVKPYCCKPRAARETYNDPGSKWKISAKLSINPTTGEKIAEPGEKIDLDAYIQASKASTDITTIVAKLKAGDESVINVHTGFYGDYAALPKDINDIAAIEAMNQSARDAFDRLPDDLKALFNNDPAQFFSAVLDHTAENLIQTYVASQAGSSEPADPAEPEGGNE